MREPMSEPRHIYVSGPMRGYDAFNFPAFFEVEDVLHGRFPGADINNPAREDCVRHGLDMNDPLAAGRALMEGATFGEAELRAALAADLAYITEHADLVVCLPGWRESKGATAEVAAANALGVPVIEYDLPIPGHAESPKSNPQPEGEGLSIRLGHHRLKDFTPEEAQEHARRMAALDHPSNAERPGAARSGALAARSGDEVRQRSATGGEKGAKLAVFDQVSPEVERLVAEHFGKGARKYAAHNFRRGYPWSLSYSALRRHLGDFWGGKEFDTCSASGHQGCLFEHPEDGRPYVGEEDTCWNHTGSPEIVAVIWHAMVLAEFWLHHKNYDDRYWSPKENDEQADH